MIIDPILGDLPRSTNDDFNVSPTSYEISTEDLVVSYTATKTVTRALAFANGKWIYCTSFTDKTITFSNADFVVGENSITVMDVNYSDGTYGRFTGVVTVTKNEEAPAPPPVVDNVPVVSQNIPNQAGILGDMFTITYTASDDKGISKHELYSGSSYIVKTPVSDGNNHSITFRPTVAGVKNCKIRITDTKGQAVLSNVFTITVSEPVINEPPTLVVNSTDSNYNGEYSINYTISDPNKDKMTVSLVVEGGNPITVSTNAVNGTYTYRGSGLDAGVHSMVLKVSDGENLVSENLTVSIPQRPIVQASLLRLYQKDGSTKIGDLDDAFSAYVTEERNGIFELEINYPNEFPYADQIINENFITCKPNDNQDIQKFRIYSVKQLMKNTLTVRARHESYDIATDHIEKLDLKNASCEYVLNELFRNSFFSTDFRGFSDIVNAQDYYIENTNLLNAIAGKEGSIIDTFGTGAEIYRNNKEIHVLNRRGHDNDVTIEFGKNLTDFVLEVDLTGLETRVGGFAKYRDAEGNEVTIKSDWVDSPFIENFAHPYVNTAGRRDYSAHFDNENKPTKEKLNLLCADEFKINKRDLPKNKYTLKFIPLSKCVGYEATQDAISLCDTVRVIDPRFRLDSKVKVIKYTYDVLKQRYESMELGDPRTTLGNIIGGSSKPPALTEEDVKDIINNSQGKDFPNTLPATPVLTAKVKGFSSIELSWTFENKVYYQYEVYASKEKGFTPNVFDLIHRGQTSSYTFEAKPAETWYFRVCGINSHNERTAFSTEVEVVTRKGENLDAYFTEVGIGNAVANSISAGYVEAGSIKGGWIDARHLTLTDGNGVRVIDIDDFGRARFNVTELSILSKAVETQEGAQSKISALSIGTRNLALNSDRYLSNSEGVLIDFPLVESEIKKARGKEIALSFDLELVDAIATAEGSKRVGIEFWTVNTEGVTTWYGCWIQLGAEAKNMNERISNILRLNDEPIERMGNLGLYIQGVTSGTVRAGRPKVEIGNKVSQYTKAFEDVDANINVAYDRIQTVEERTTPDGIVKTVKEHKTDGRATFVTGTEFLQTKDDFQYRFENSGKPNELINSDFSELFRGWKTEAYDADIWVDYNSSFTGVETVGCHAVYMGLWNENSSCWAMQRFKPRNPRMINFTVGGCYHYDDVRIERENPYPMAYIYVVITNKDGTEEYYNQDDVLGYGSHINWVTYQRTFGRSGKEIDYIDFYVYKRSTTGKFRITNLDFREGTEHRKWRPGGEIYSNTTKIDGEGVEIIHDNGSKSRMSHEKIEFTAPNGNATLRIKDGGLNMFTASNNEMCGFVKPSQIGQDWYNGVSISTYASGDYITLGHSDSQDETTWRSVPSIVIAKSDNFDPGHYWAGTNFVNQSVLLRTRTHLKHVLDVDTIGKFEFYANSNTPHMVYNSTDNKFCLMGDNELVLGIREGEANKTVLKIIESPYERIQNYHHWNFNNWTMWNMQTAHTLSAQSNELKARTKDINDIHGVWSMTDGEIRYTCRETQSIGNTGVNLEDKTIQEDRTLVVELPQILAENIENDYHINIGKISWGDYRIVEKNPYYFVIESNVDNFQFTYEIVGKQLYNKTRNASIASRQYDYNDAPEDVENAEVVFNEDNGQIGKGDFWKIYTDDFLKALEQQKMNTLNFTNPS